MMNWIWCDYRRNRRHNIRVQWVEMKGKHNGKSLSLISLITHDGDDDDGKNWAHQSQWVKSDG